MFNEGKNEGLLGEHRLIMSEEGMVDLTSTEETKINWSGIKGLKEDSDYFFIYNTAVSACILSKRDLKDVEIVRDYFIERIPKYVKKTDN